MYECYSEEGNILVDIEMCNVRNLLKNLITIFFFK